MSWVCLNCSTSNEDSDTCCYVCGYDRPTDTRTREREPEVVEGKIVFSTFSVIVESAKETFRTVGKFFRKIKEKIARRERPPRELREKEDPPREESRERITPPRREEDPRLGGDLAMPWSEHAIRFHTDVIESKGYVRFERSELNGIKGYTFYKADGSGQFIRVDMLVMLKMASRL
jgi:hypothetical protein